MKRNTIITILSYSLSILFVYAASAKAMVYTDFMADIAKSPLLVNYNNAILAPGILGLEFLTVSCCNLKRPSNWAFIYHPSSC